MPAAWVLHVDLDAFLAAVEVARRPELRGVPVVVGGDGDPHRARQVVATASYEARAFGVRSGMPLRMAYRRCPQAVFLPVDHAACEAASSAVMAVLRTFPAVVEVIGWDEAFLAVHTDDPRALAADVRAAVLERTGLSCAVGIGETKQRAKLAVAPVKPGGIGMITEADWMPLMADRPVDALWGIGPGFARSLAAAGLHTVGDLAAADPADLAARFGPTIGPRLHRLGLGEDDSPVSGEAREPVSRSRSVTFPRDLVGRAEVERAVVALAREVTEGAVAAGYTAARVAVTVRTASFFTRTRVTKLPSPTDDAAVVERAALDVLGRFPLDRPVRLLGVRVEYAATAPDREP